MDKVILTKTELRDAIVEYAERHRGYVRVAGDSVELCGDVKGTEVSGIYFRIKGGVPSTATK